MDTADPWSSLANSGADEEFEFGKLTTGRKYSISASISGAISPTAKVKQLLQKAVAANSSGSHTINASLENKKIIFPLNKLSPELSIENAGAENAVVESLCVKNKLILTDELVQMRNQLKGLNTKNTVVSTNYFHFNAKEDNILPPKNKELTRNSEVPLKTIDGHLSEKGLNIYLIYLLILLYYSISKFKFSHSVHIYI